MSSVSESVTSVSANPNPEQQAEAPAVQQQADAAAEQAAQREAEQREQAEQTRQQAVKAFRKGESAYRAGLLESGRLSGEYIRQRLALGDQRAAAVQALEGAFAPWSSTAVDVSRLVRTWEAFRLLALEQGLCGEGRKQGPADGIPYGHFRDAWSRLVERRTGTGDESYVLLPGREAECLTLFRESVQAGLSREACGEKVAALVREHAQQQAAAEKQRAAEADAKAKAEREAAEKAAAELQAAQQTADKAAAEAKAKGDKATAEAAAQALAELETKQRAMVEQQAKAEQAERERARAEKAAAEQARREKAAAEKAARKAQTADKPATVATETPPGKDAKAGTITGNLLRIAEAGTVKDVAGMVVELITGTGKPEAVLEEVLRQLKAGGHVHKRAVGAIDAALLVLTRKEAPKPPAGPSPVDVANRLPLPSSPAPAEEMNGQPATAGAA
jgi:hypothetical protein